METINEKVANSATNHSNKKMVATKHRYKTKGILVFKGRDFKPYSQFKDLTQFNKNFEMFMAVHKKEFSKKQYIAINRIRKFGAKDNNVGVAYASLETYQRAIKEVDGIDISVDTIKRAIQKCASLGGLTVHTGVKPDKTQAPNVLIFTPYQYRKVYKLKNHIAHNETKYSAAEIDKMIENELQVNLRFFDVKTALRASDNPKPPKKVDKPKSLYVRFKEILVRKNAIADTNSYCSIAYKYLPKLREADNKLSKAQAEDLIFEDFMNVMYSRSAKNPFAVFSSRLKNLVALFKGNGKEYSKGELALKRGKKVGVIPDFLIEQQEDPVKRAEMRATQKAMNNGLNGLTKAGYVQKKVGPLPEWFYKQKEEEAKKEAERAAKNRKEQENHDAMLASMTPEQQAAYYAKIQQELLERFNS